jgi:hypothetical protein
MYKKVCRAWRGQKIMVKVKLGDELIQSKIRFKVRFDFKGEYRPGRFFGPSMLYKLFYTSKNYL